MERLKKNSEEKGNRTTSSRNGWLGSEKRIGERGRERKSERDG